MTSFWRVPMIVVAFLTWLSAPPAGLGDVAKREALRRQLAPRAAHSLTNENLNNAEVADAVARPPGAPPPAADPAAAAAAAASDDGVPPAAATKPAAEGGAATSEKRDEKWWRDNMLKARSDLKLHEQQLEEVQVRINVLTTQAINRDDPAQQAKLATDRLLAIQTLDKLKALVTTDQQRIVTLQDDARRAGVPPGWVR